MILLCCGIFLYYFKNIFDKNYFVDININKAL